MATINEVKRGNVLSIDNELFAVTEVQRQKMARGGGLYIVKMKSMSSGAVSQRRFRSGENVELAHLDKRLMEYLYDDGAHLIFMDADTYEQMPISKEFVGDDMLFLKANTQVMVTFHEGSPVGVELPAAVELEVTETQAFLKGATATSTYKPAVLETGLKTNVPPFIEKGEVIKVDTRTGEYLERAK
jgi:elongation factor P